MPRKLDGRFYTYILCTHDQVPYYVGCGTWRRMGEYPHTNEEAVRILQSGQIILQFSKEFATREEAVLEERALILLYGRREHGGLLVNRNYGGNSRRLEVHGPYKSVSCDIPDGYLIRSGEGTGRPGKAWTDARRQAEKTRSMTPDQRILRSEQTRAGIARKRAEREKTC